MLLTMEYATLFWIFGFCSSEIQATTHWIVTETGLIQPRDDTPFEMNRPYDLLAFLNQDTRWDNVFKYHSELTLRQSEINRMWKDIEKEGDVNKLIHLDTNCHKAGPFQALDWYGSYLEDGSIKNIDSEDYQIDNPSYGEDVDVPDCKKISSLTFSMAAFEHLKSIRNRENLSINAELSLPERISPIMTLEQFGHWTASVLKRNSSSWLHYNMASLYWRARGNAVKALECSRRAVHYAPREYKSIALLSLGTILHRSKRPEDAITILEAVIDHDPYIAYGHFVLANAFAILGEYNNSYFHYDEAYKLDNMFEQALKNKYGAKCVQRLLKKMVVVHKLLRKFRDLISEYLLKEDHWMRTQAAFLKTMSNKDKKDYRNVEEILQKWTEFTDLDMKELKKWGDKYSFIQYYINGPMYDPKWAKDKGVFAMDNVVAIQKLVKHISKNADPSSDQSMVTDHSKTTNGKIVKELGPLPAFPELSRVKITFHGKMPPPPDSSSDLVDDLINEFEVGLPLYPSNMKVSRNIHDFDRDPDWPPESACNHYAHNQPANPDFFYPVFMPFENKGLGIKGLLTEKIGVAANTEHDLPWHPPICSSKDAKKSQRAQILDVIPTGYLRQTLLEYVCDGNTDNVRKMQDVEIGHRIYSAMQAELAPKWIINTLASLYWRVRNNNPYALNCLLSASKVAPNKYKDLVMSSLASVYLEMGYLDEAFNAIEEAFKVNSYEPVTNFIIAVIQMIRKDRESQLAHMKTVIRVDANFLDGLAKPLLNAWACHIKKSDNVNDLYLSSIADWADKEENCKRNSEISDDGDGQCSNRDDSEAKALLRLMEMHENENAQPDDMDTNVFDPFILNMPLERSDKKAHQENFEIMLEILDNLKGCGSKGCSYITPEDLDLTEEDCSYQYLQIDYWMHVIALKQMLQDNELKLISEANLNSEHKGRVPDCKAFIDPNQDFFLEKMFKVDMDGWKPLLALMHQVEDFYGVPDYSLLGSKIAKMVETKPRWWVGMLSASWWCAGAGRGRCALRCAAAAHALAPPRRAHAAVAALANMLVLQNKTVDGKLLSQLSFYLSPKHNTEAFLVAASYTINEQYQQAIWMYRYALTFDAKFLPAKACLHATMCNLLFKDTAKTTRRYV